MLASRKKGIMDAGSEIVGTKLIVKSRDCLFEITRFWNLAFNFIVHN